MKRHIPGLHSRQQDGERPLEGLFLVRVEWASYRWHPSKAFFRFASWCSNRTSSSVDPFRAGSIARERALWKLNWFLRDFGYDMELLTQDQMDEKALINLRGVVRTTYKTLNGHTFQNLEAFAPEADWENCPVPSRARMTHRR